MHKQLMTGLAISGLWAASAQAVDITANGGWNSEYIFRGVPQADSSPFVGADIEHAGFFAGIWGADVEQAGIAAPLQDEGEGLEIDYYGGYSGNVGEFGFGVGATWYTYTDDFDDEYLELNLNGSWRFLSVDVAIGEYDNGADPTLDYQFYSVTGEYNKFYGTVGIFADDFDGEYYEVGYADTLSVGDVDLFDYSFAAIYSSDDLLGGDDDTSLVLSVSKTFQLYSD